MLNDRIKTCPCCSGIDFNLCCGRFITNDQAPDSPEQLMRSRYTAYTLKNENYLLGSWHPSTRPESLDLTNDTTQWMGLKIISTLDSTVNFVAYFTQDTLNSEKFYSLTEQSNFVKENNWFYLDGHDVKTVQLTKNMPCPCQSGKKYKRCCGSYYQPFII